MTDAVAQRLVKRQAFQASLGRPIVYREGVLMTAEPTDELAGVHADVVAGVAEVLGAGHESNEPGFIPHVSLAYANAPEPTEPAVNALKAKAPVCSFSVAEVRLVKQYRVPGCYHWEPVTAVQLKG